MVEIDAVERALAVIGIEAVLSREVEKIRLSDVKDMVGLNKKVYQEAKRIVDGEKSSVPLTDVNYKRTLKELTDEYNAGQLESMVAAFPPALHDISGSFLVKAQEVVKLLRSLFPVTTKETLLGPENILPPALAVRKFATLLDVLNDPMRVLAHISCGSLLKSQVTVMNEVYPTFSECVTDAFKEAGSDAKAKKKSFVLPGLVAVGYGTWAGQPRVSPQLQKRLQDNFVNAETEKKKPPGSEGTSTSVVAKEALTNTQRANFPNALKG